jgi:uncharacterized protein (TIRG00374 family)
MSNKLFSKIKNISQSLRQKGNGYWLNRLVFVFLCLVGILALSYVIGQIEVGAVFQAVKELSWVEVLALVGCTLLVVFISAWRWQIILRGFGYREHLWKLMKRVMKASAVSFLVPSFEISGETFKGLELQRHGVSVPASFASVFFDYILILSINWAGGLLILFYVLFQGLAFKVEWAILGALIALAVFFLMLRRLFTRGTLSRFLARCIPLNEKTVEAVQLFDYGLSFFVRESRRYLILALGCTVLGFLWELVQLFLILSFLGVQLNLTQIFVFYLVIYFFNSVPVFGGLGFGETGAFISGSFLGVPDSTSLSLAILLRFRQVVLLVLGGSFFMTTAIKESLKRLRTGRVLEEQSNRPDNNH